MDKGLETGQINFLPIRGTKIRINFLNQEELVQVKDTHKIGPEPSFKLQITEYKYRLKQQCLKQHFKCKTTFQKGACLLSNRFSRFIDAYCVKQVQIQSFFLKFAVFRIIKS